MQMHLVRFRRMAQPHERATRTTHQRVHLAPAVKPVRATQPFLGSHAPAGRTRCRIVIGRLGLLLMFGDESRLRSLRLRHSSYLHAIESFPRSFRRRTVRNANRGLTHVSSHFAAKLPVKSNRIAFNAASRALPNCPVSRYKFVHPL